jgi:hypothetical protein
MACSVNRTTSSRTPWRTHRRSRYAARNLGQFWTSRILPGTFPTTITAITAASSPKPTLSTPPTILSSTPPHSLCQAPAGSTNSWPSPKNSPSYALPRQSHPTPILKNYNAIAFSASKHSSPQTSPTTTCPHLSPSLAPQDTNPHLILASTS